MSWRTVVISSRCKLDLKMSSMVIRGEDTKRIFLDEIALLLIENPVVSHPLLKGEHRVTIDRDLCEF